MGPPKRILLVTNSEHGQANVFLATAYALLTLPDQDVEVHFASFPSIQPSVLSTSQLAQRHNPLARPIIFHTISGPAMVTAWSRPSLAAERASLSSVDTVLLIYAIRRMAYLLKVLLPWTGPEFFEIFTSITSIHALVNPHLTAADPAFSPALTALRHLQAPFLILSPNTIKDFSLPAQPGAEALWKYPCIGSPDPFPVPALHIPANILLVLVALLCAQFFDTHRTEIQRYFAEHFPSPKGQDQDHHRPQSQGRATRKIKVTTLNDLSLNSCTETILVANLPQVEFPLAVVPRNVIPCGPMLRAWQPLRETDPELAAWVVRGPTVYVNLGTHVVVDEEFAVEMARGLRIMLDGVAGVLWRDKRLKGLQVLWKLKRKEEYSVVGPGSRIYELLGEELDTGKVKVVEWFDAEPMAVLEMPTMVCAVHHGGANSFLEAVSAGVPQVVLPVWMDTYDFARRAEILGIGRWGNRTNEGVLCKGKELGSVLIDVLIGGRSSVYMSRAKELADLCRRSGGGRVIAARKILEEMETVQRKYSDDEIPHQCVEGNGKHWA